MSLEKDGIVVILSSPSGAGKPTLVKKIAAENNFKISKKSINRFKESKTSCHHAIQRRFT